MVDEKNKDPETIVVNIGENYGDSCIEDSVSSVSSKSRKPEGYVEVYSIDADGNKQKVGKSNLVLYLGREWIASRLCGINNTNIVPSPDQFISWFGVGDGGAPIGEPLKPNSPTNVMSGLSNEVPFNNDNIGCADLRNGHYYKYPFDSIEYQRDETNGNRWLVLKIITTLSISDANGYNLNEAGLFVAASNEGGFGGDFNLFSMVTFPSIVKDNSRQLVFYWYLYC